MATEKSIKSQGMQHDEELVYSIEEHAGTEGFVWLDSSLKLNQKGRKSLVAWQPKFELRLENGRTRLFRSGTLEEISNGANFLNKLESLCVTEDMTAIGYFSYEAMLPFVGVTPKNSEGIFPDAHFYLYDDLIEIDKPLDLTYSDSQFQPGKIVSEPDKENYMLRIAQIIDYIKDGDIYQANYTDRFVIESKNSAFDVYKRLRHYNPAPYAAFLNFGSQQVLSSSPERMFRLDRNHLVSSPIKGTIARGDSAANTVDNLAKLVSSAKDRAELLMIVDLIRNDLGKVATTGTVNVKKNFNPEVYSSVIHLVAEIEAELSPGTSITKVCRALFPGGSITGAPKKRSVEIIDDFERTPRSVYTGSIGYMNKHGAEFNIAIRTIYCQDDKWYLHAGGGIVADSDPEDEYLEMKLKSKNLLRALEIISE